MANSKMKRKRAPKSVLKLPDLEQSRSAVLNSLTSPSSQRTYDHAIREFIEWYCSASTCVSRQCGGWRTRQRIAGSLAPIWRQGFVA